MKGIILKDSVKLFGFKSGFGFWFRLNFVDPIQKFIFLNITKKPYCTYSGFHCNKKDCKHKHLFTKKEILKHWEEAHKEMEKVETGEDRKCVCCNDEEGTIKIPNPNFYELNQWLVCENCRETLEIQQELVFLSLSKIENPQRMEELNDRLLEISEQTGKPIINVRFDKVGTEFEITKDGEVKETGHKYKSSIIEFNGKNDKK